MKAKVPLTIAGGHSPDAPSSTSKGKQHVFRDHAGGLHVTVTVPANVNAVPHAGDWDDKFEDAAKPNRRRVINLLFNGALDPNSPVELRVTLHANERNRANVKLVYYNPDAGAWQSFSGAHRDGNELVVLISKWYADPGVGVDAE